MVENRRLPFDDGRCGRVADATEVTRQSCPRGTKRDGTGTGGGDRRLPGIPPCAHRRASRLLRGRIGATSAWLWPEGQPGPRVLLYNPLRPFTKARGGSGGAARRLDQHDRCPNSHPVRFDRRSGICSTRRFVHRAPDVPAEQELPGRRGAPEASGRTSSVVAQRALQTDRVSNRCHSQFRREATSSPTTTTSASLGRRTIERLAPASATTALQADRAGTRCSHHPGDAASDAMVALSPRRAEPRVAFGRARPGANAPDVPRPTLFSAQRQYRPRTRS